MAEPCVGRRERERAPYLRSPEEDNPHLSGVLKASRLSWDAYCPRRCTPPCLWLSCQSSYPPPTPSTPISSSFPESWQWEAAWARKAGVDWRGLLAGIYQRLMVGLSIGGPFQGGLSLVWLLTLPTPPPIHSHACPTQAIPLIKGYSNSVYRHTHPMHSHTALPTAKPLIHSPAHSNTRHTHPTQATPTQSKPVNILHRPHPLNLWPHSSFPEAPGH
jgi:hypothetical protein